MAPGSIPLNLGPPAGFGKMAPRFRLGFCKSVSGQSLAEVVGAGGGGTSARSINDPQSVPYGRVSAAALPFGLFLSSSSRAAA